MATATLSIATTSAVRAAEIEDEQVRDAVNAWAWTTILHADARAEGDRVAMIDAREARRFAWDRVVNLVQSIGRVCVVGGWAYEPTPCGRDVFTYPIF